MYFRKVTHKKTYESLISLLVAYVGFFSNLSVLNVLSYDGIKCDLLQRKTKNFHSVSKLSVKSVCDPLWIVLKNEPSL